MYRRHPVIQAMRCHWPNRLLCRLGSCLAREPALPDPVRTEMASLPMTLTVQHRGDSDACYVIVNQSITLIDPETRRRIYRQSFPRWRREGMKVH